MTPKMLLQEFAREILPNSKCFQPILCIQEKYVMTEEQSIVVTQHINLAEHSDVKGSAKEVSAYPLLTVIQITIVILLWRNVHWWSKMARSVLKEMSVWRILDANTILLIPQREFVRKCFQWIQERLSLPEMRTIFSFVRTAMLLKRDSRVHLILSHFRLDNTCVEGTLRAKSLVNCATLIRIVTVI